MSKVTVEDVVKLTPRELIQKMTTKSVEPAEASGMQVVHDAERQVIEEAIISQEDFSSDDQPEERVPASEQVQVADNFAPSTFFNKKQLKGLFDADAVFTKGQIVQLEGGNLIVTSVENSSGRVKFEVQETGEIFSQAAAVLRGGKEELPYKKGDFVLWDERVFEVIGLNPANRNVVINLDGKKRYLKISKVSRVINPNGQDGPSVVEESAQVDGEQVSP